MKKIRIVFGFILVFAVISLTGCAEELNQNESSAGEGVEFDAGLAEELGADEYGMRRYVMALLKAGPNRDQDEETADELQNAHMANIQRLAEEGQLILAGPFLDNGELRGIYVFDVTTVEEAATLTQTDPAIQAGRLEMELHPWYGPAALIKVTELNERVTRTKF
jgi:uncharacterized protein YciI